ncbi:hypothetical protein TSUD_70340 [Trifolium subterraneum]|uniref:Fe2OG dioxygenase domain-containing protein n=1 Tax=Trifolium subterraneum TaxID=3900 RepID=A0A2Z6M030_TRISU|nr:hypothetical protein TSUD_70340 [Trifolium subterraneum]
MESINTPSLPFCPPPKDQQGEDKIQYIDFTSLQKEGKVPKEFIWPSDQWVKSSGENIELPLIDIRAIKNDEVAMVNAAEIVKKACIKYGAFEVTNIAEGVDLDFSNVVLQETSNIFKLPLSKKISAIKKDCGFSIAHAERYTTVLPWKETFTFMYKHNNKNETQVVDVLNYLLGQEFQQVGANLNGALGNGPHCDPISLTILLQDQVGGLEIFADNKWLAIPPKPNTFVINIGDTFMALTNGLYKSCLHRVLVSNELERKSLTFFLNPRGDKTVSPPKELLEKEESRKYPDYKWNDLYKFTQKTRRVDANTLDSFVAWQQSSKPSNF